MRDKSERRFHIKWEELFSIGELFPEGMIARECKPGFPIFYINRFLREKLGYESQIKPLLQNSLLVHSDDLSYFNQTLLECQKSHQPFSAEYRMLCSDKGNLWVSDSGGLYQDENGEEILLSSYHIIQENSIWQEFDRMFPSLPCGICQIALDQNLTIIQANRSCLKLFGTSAGLCGKSLLCYLEHPEQVMHTIKSNQDRQYFEFEARIIKENNIKHWILFQCSYHSARKGSLSCTMIDISRRKADEEKLRISEEEYRIAIEQTETLIDIYDIATKTLIQSPKGASALGLETVMENVPQSIIETGCITSESISDYLNFYSNIHNQIPKGNVFLRLKTCANELRWFDAKYTLIYDSDHQPQRAIISYKDVTQQREKELAYQKWSQYFQIQQADHIGYYEYNLSHNRYERSESLPYAEFPTHFSSFTETVHYIAENCVYEDDRSEYLKVFDREWLLMNYYEGEREIRLEHRRKQKNGEIFWALGSIQLVCDPYTDDVKAFVLIKSIDSEKKKALQLQTLSERDTLTKLFNRGTLTAKIMQILAEDSTAQHAFIMVDVDHFKELNDNYGHQFGDWVLKDVAALLKNMLRKNDLCGRLGGDEFILFLKNVSFQDALTKKLQTFCQALHRFYEAGAEITGSFGVAFYPQHGGSFEELYHKADLALYEAKRKGRNQFIIYHPEIQDLRPNSPLWDCSVQSDTSQNEK